MLLTLLAFAAAETMGSKNWKDHNPELKLEYEWASKDTVVKYDDATGIVTVTGTGSMDTYESEEKRPWHEKREAFKQAEIHEGVTSLAQYCFGHCTKLTSVDIIANVPSIPMNAFISCSALNQISLPGSIQSIGDYAFGSCVSINNFIVPGGVTNIGIRAFADCTTMESVALPASIQKIERAAFAGCAALTNVFYCGNGFACQTTDDHVYDSFPESVTQIHIVSTYQGDTICGVPAAKDLTPECEQFDVNEWWEEFPKEPEIAQPTASDPLEIDYFDGTPWGFVATVILIMVVLALVTAKNLYSNVQRQLNEVDSDDLLAMDEADDAPDVQN